MRLPEARQSDRLRKALAETGSDSEFRDGIGTLRTLGIETCFKTVERVSERVGAEVARERHGPFARAAAPKEAPPNPPELLVVQADGMRVREVAGDAGDDGWRECKVGVVASALPGRTGPAGEYEGPATLVQTCLATMDGVHAFGAKLRAEAERRGLRGAAEVVAVSDAGHGLPEMWEREFPGVPWVVDFYHVSSRLHACAAAVWEPGARLDAAYHRWKRLLWAGRTGRLLAELRRQARRHAARPGTLEELAEGSPGRVLWEHVLYIQRYRSRMDYPEYRRMGWPVASGQVEALAKIVGSRMKAASKRWTREGAEAIATVIAERACRDGRWERMWPPAPKSNPTRETR